MAVVPARRAGGAEAGDVGGRSAASWAELSAGGAQDGDARCEHGDVGGGEGGDLACC